jgi:class 3 adenylate cyclase
VHAGEVERDGDDVVGRNVTIACRLCEVASPGEVLASAVVADLADSASDLAFGDLREHQLAGLERPVIARPATRR